MRRALVTGSTSFPGLALVARLLAEGIDVHAVIRPSTRTSPLEAMARRTPSVPLRLHRHDGGAASLQRIVAAARPDVTFHLAGFYLREHVSEDIDSLIASNIALGTHLLDALQRSGFVNVVNVGSYAQFFAGAAPRPLNLYAATKEAFATILAHYADTGLATTTVILFDTYGPGDRRHKLVPALVSALAAGTPLPLPREEVTIDLTYRDDVASALLTAGRGLLREPAAWRDRRFAASGFRHTVREVVATFEAVAGREIRKQWGGWKIPARHIAVPWNGPRLPGWTPDVLLAEGLRRTLAEDSHAD